MNGTISKKKLLKVLKGLGADPFIFVRYFDKRMAKTFCLAFLHGKNKRNNGSAKHVTILSPYESLDYFLKKL